MMSGVRVEARIGERDRQQEARIISEQDRQQEVRIGEQDRQQEALYR